MVRFLFRCDASAAIGVGHFMRCSALAHALQERGHQVCFAMRETTTLVDQLFRAYRFRLAPVRATSCMEEETPAVLRLVEGENFNAVLIDHYEASPTYFAKLGSPTRLVAVLDDLADRDLTSVDWLLNQNLDAETLPYRVRSDCVRLLGPRYSLLRPQFIEAGKMLCRAFAKRDCKVLITLGGGDSSLLYVDVLNSLNQLVRPLRLRLVAPDVREEVRAAWPKLSRHSVEILHNAANMAEHMAWADLSINAGGSTCWELCCLGVPMLITVLSRDQEIVAVGLERAGAGKRLSGVRDSESAVAPAVEHLLAHPHERATMSAKGRALVDGRGAGRVASSLEAAIAQRLGKEHRHENAYHRSA